MQVMRQSTLGKEIGSLQRVLEKSQEVTESVETPQTTAEIEGLKRQIEELTLQREALHHVYDIEDLQSQLRMLKPQSMHSRRKLTDLRNKSTDPNQRA